MLRVLAWRPPMRSSPAAGRAGSGQKPWSSTCAVRVAVAGATCCRARDVFPPLSLSQGFSPCHGAGRRRSRACSAQSLVVMPSLRRHLLLHGPGRPEAAPAAAPLGLEFWTSGVGALQPRTVTGISAMAVRLGLLPQRQSPPVEYACLSVVRLTCCAEQQQTLAFSFRFISTLI